MGLFPKINFNKNHPGIKKIKELMIPVIFGSSVTQVNLIFDTIIASFLITGSISWLYMSDRFIELPLALFGKSIATVFDDVIKEEINHNKNFTAAHLLKLYPNNETIRTIVSFESNEKSEDSARVTIKEIFHQLELSSEEKIYFDLLNRYTDGQNLSDDERKFIKNFKK